MDAISLGLWSYHFNNREIERTEVHNLVGYQYEHAYVATYKNSYGKRSHTLAYVTNERCYQGVCADLLVGVVSGYKEATKMQVTPYVLPRLKLSINENVGINAVIIPGKLVAAGFEVKF